MSSLLERVEFVEDVHTDFKRSFALYLYTIDDLRDVVAENMQLRQVAATEARSLIDEQAREFMRWLDARGAGDTLRAIRAQAEQQRDDVLARAQRRLAGGESPDVVMRYLAETLTNKLLHAPVSRLGRASAVEQGLLLSSARELFGVSPPTVREAGDNSDATPDPET